MDEVQLKDIARRHGFSDAAVLEVARALQSGSGIAQFNHSELGGYGQWMPGMIMIGDMFNSSLKYRVDSLCSDVARVAAQSPQPSRTMAAGVSPDAGRWWPADLGSPASAGAQGGMRYAYFAASHRLAVEAGGALTLYDTGDHQIFGVSQQQGVGPGSILFTSQRGTVALEALGVIERR